MNISTLLIIILILVFNGYSQKIISKKIINSSVNQSCASALRTPDNNILITGYTTDSETGYINILLLKATTSGDTIWSKVYGGENNDYCNKVIYIPETGYLLSCTSLSYNESASFMYFILVDFEGEIIWEKSHEGKFYDMIFDKDCFIILSKLNNLSFHLYKMNFEGNIIKSKEIFTEINYPNQFPPHPVTGNTITSVVDSGYLICGTIEAEFEAPYIAKLDSSWNIEWEVGYPNSNMFFSSLYTDISLIRNDQILLGYSDCTRSDASSSSYSTINIIQFNPVTGQNIWNYSIGSSTYPKFIRSDSSIYTFFRKQSDVPFGIGLCGISLNGSEIFNMVINFGDDYVENIETASNILILDDRTLALLGTTKGPAFQYNEEKIFLVRINPDTMNISSINDANINFKDEFYPIFPNPSNSSINIRVVLSTEGSLDITIYNILGQKIKEINKSWFLGEYSYRMNMGRYPSGFYFVNVKSKTINETRKYLIIK